VNKTQAVLIVLKSALKYYDAHPTDSGRDGQTADTLMLKIERAVDILEAKPSEPEKEHRLYTEGLTFVDKLPGLKGIGKG